MSSNKQTVIVSKYTSYHKSILPPFLKFNCSTQKKKLQYLYVVNGKGADDINMVLARIPRFGHLFKYVIEVMGRIAFTLAFDNLVFF